MKLANRRKRFEAASVRISPRHLDELDALAEQNGICRSAVVRVAVARLLLSTKKRGQVLASLS